MNAWDYQTVGWRTISFLNELTWYLYKNELIKSVCLFLTFILSHWSSSCHCDNITSWLLGFVFDVGVPSVYMLL